MSESRFTKENTAPTGEATKNLSFWASRVAHSLLRSHPGAGRDPVNLKPLRSETSAGYFIINKGPGCFLRKRTGLHNLRSFDSLRSLKMTGILSGESQDPVKIKNRCEATHLTVIANERSECGNPELQAKWQALANCSGFMGCRAHSPILLREITSVRKHVSHWGPGSRLSSQARPSLVQDDIMRN